MLSEELRDLLTRRIASAEHPREQAVEVMLELQRHYGHMSDEAMEEAAELLHMTPVELEGLATFYDHIYREPVGKHVIHVCDSLICWMEGHQSVAEHIMSQLNVTMGGTSEDGAFTLLPVCCIGYCDRAPAMTIDGKVYGRLTAEKIDRILRRLKEESEHSESETE